MFDVETIRQFILRRVAKAKLFLETSPGSSWYRLDSLERFGNAIEVSPSERGPIGEFLTILV
jgi:hypothetical protein